MGFHMSKKARLCTTIGISFTFFAAEIAVGFYTHSLALVADAFHYMNDLVGFMVALAAILISERAESPQDLSFGWQRAQLLGAFFNGVFLLALGISIFLQSIERFIAIEEVQNPKLVLIIGCVGLALNILSATVLHDHDHGHAHGHDHGHVHSHSVADGIDLTDTATTEPLGHEEHRHQLSPVKSNGRDLGMLAVLLHVIGDAINNIGVIIAAAVIWKAKYKGRFYADPGVSMGIAVMILISSLPLVKRSGSILLQSAPQGVNHDDVKHDLEKIPGISSVHELHIWRLDQKKTVASAHLVVNNQTTMTNFMKSARIVGECLHAYGIHSATLQPELAHSTESSGGQEHVQEIIQDETLRRRITASSACQISCGSLCEHLMCCK